jgi:hypothetical protein
MSVRSISVTRIFTPVSIGSSRTPKLCVCFPLRTTILCLACRKMNALPLFAPECAVYCFLGKASRRFGLCALLVIYAEIIGKIIYETVHEKSA